MKSIQPKQITGIAILTALYCVLSAMMKIPFIGAISLDLGYIVLAVGCVMFGVWGAFIGAIGCGIESILFSPYGFSISWFCANLIVGAGCGYVFKKTNITWKRIIAILVFMAIAMLGVKTIIECNLYGIPFEVKIVKNAVAFIIDSITMIIGLFISKRVDGKIFEDNLCPDCRADMRDSNNEEILLNKSSNNKNIAIKELLERTPEPTMREIKEGFFIKW